MNDSEKNQQGVGIYLQALLSLILGHSLVKENKKRVERDPGSIFFTPKEINMFGLIVLNGLNILMGAALMKEEPITISEGIRVIREKLDAVQAVLDADFESVRRLKDSLATISGIDAIEILSLTEVQCFLVPCRVGAQNTFMMSFKVTLADRGDGISFGPLECLVSRVTTEGRTAGEAVKDAATLAMIDRLTPQYRTLFQSRAAGLDARAYNSDIRIFHSGKMAVALKFPTYGVNPSDIEFSEDCPEETRESVRVLINDINT